MTCAACSSRIEKVLNKMDDVDASVNLTTEKATVEYDRKVLNKQEGVKTATVNLTTENAGKVQCWTTCSAYRYRLS